jgi:hypothetical protein
MEAGFLGIFGSTLLIITVWVFTIPFRESDEFALNVILFFLIVPPMIFTFVVGCFFLIGAYFSLQGDEGKNIAIAKQGAAL